MTGANYGLYGSKEFYILVPLVAFVLVVLACFFEQYRIVLFLIAVFSLVSLLVVPGFVLGRRRVVPRIIAAAQIRPESTVLDVGTGRGFPAIEIAKAVPGCRVIGVDIWDQPAKGQIHTGFLLGNTRENAERNAVLEGVRDRVEFRREDAREMSFGPETFDAVVSFAALHQMVEFSASGDLVVREIHRVLKRGGRFVDVDFVLGDTLVGAVRNLGFTGTEVEGTGFPVLKILSATRS